MKLIISIPLDKKVLECPLVDPTIDKTQIVFRRDKRKYPSDRASFNYKMAKYCLLVKYYLFLLLKKLVTSNRIKRRGKLDDLLFVIKYIYD